DVAEDPVIVAGDAARLNQVIVNLLANARTHTPAGTTVTVSVRHEGAGSGTRGVLRVHDDGPGIDPALQTELFTRFARGDRSRARATGGTGLGLAIVKAIVEAHHGTISVTSSPGDTTFEVNLPAKPVDPA
ncbi:ATP-binding protein, partial [Microbacterium sp.]|uniref:sensor histidine kinase n=1 Tax=Microbacterium sp. TaxID=51671 RepID=UPI002810E309